MATVLYGWTRQEWVKYIRIKYCKSGSNTSRWFYEQLNRPVSNAATRWLAEHGLPEGTRWSTVDVHTLCY